MSGIKFLSENLFDTASVTFTTGSANAQFPVSNLFNESPSVKFRSNEASVVMLIDLQQTRDIETVALAFDSKEVIGVISASFKTSVTTDFTGRPSNLIPLSSDENIGYISITEVTHRFVELTLTGSVYVELGNIFIGKALNLPQNSLSVGSFKYDRVDNRKVSENRYGQKFIDKINLTKMLSGTIEYCTVSEQDELDQLFQRHGKSNPLWMIVDEGSQAMTNGQYKLAIYGYLEKDFSWSAAGGQLYNVSVEIGQAI